MKENLEPFYNSQQIFIPPNFPHLLKVYAKAAIRTQPYDLLTWSASYFRALAEGKLPPVKLRLEYPVVRSNGGLSPGYLKLLIKQFSNSTEVDKSSLTKTWIGICLNENELKQILCLAEVYKEDSFPLNKFVAVAAGFLTKNLTQTMIMLCELFTDEPEGGSAAISSDLFVDLYTFLASLDASKENKFYDGFKEDKRVIENNQINKSFMIIKEVTETSDDTAIFDDLKDFVDNKNNSSTENQDEKESSDVVTSTDVDETRNNTQSTESSVSSSLKKIRKTPAKFHEITEQESMSFDDAYKYSQDEFESSETPGDSVTSSRNHSILLRVYSEDGEKIGSLSAMSMGEGESAFTMIDDNGEVIEQKKDVSVKERQAIIDELQKNKDEKIKNMEAIIDDLEDLAEKSQIHNISEVQVNGDFIENEKNQIEQEREPVTDNQKINVNPEAKGVVNPIFKGLFDNVADKMCAVNAFQNGVEKDIPELIVVPPIPGIGPVVDNEIMDEFLKYVRETASDQCDMFMPRDIRHYFCPPLEKI